MSVISPLKVFLSYAHEDEAMKERLDLHLTALKRSGKIDTWNDREIVEGMELDNVTKNELSKAEIILLLVSTDFLASKYVWEIELANAMERHRNKSAVVIPIFLRPCDWIEMPFAGIKGLPLDSQPVTTFDDEDEAFLQIAIGIRNVVENIDQMINTQ